MSIFLICHIKRLLTVYLILTLTKVNAQNIDIHGHRGTRYWMPENSLSAFYEAVKLGAKWIELDLVCTKDHELIVNHDPYFKKSIFSEFPKKSILQLNLAECKKAYWGIKDQKKYPYQQKIKSQILTIEEVIKNVEAYCQANGFPLPYWNIEIKSLPHKKKWYPERKLYAKIVVEKIKNLNLGKRFLLQSFDKKLLQQIYTLNKNLPLFYLVIKPGKVEKRIKKLGFTPQGINPYYKFLTENFIKNAHDKNLQVIPWTVNQPEAIIKLKKWNVDGIISDVPDWVKFLITEEPVHYEIIDNALEFSEKFLQTIHKGGNPNLMILQLYIAKEINFKNSDEQIKFYQNLYTAFTKILSDRNPESFLSKSFHNKKIIGLQRHYFSLNQLKKLTQNAK